MIKQQTPRRLAATALVIILYKLHITSRLYLQTIFIRYVYNRMYLDSKVDTLLSVMKGQEKSCAFVAYYWSENVV